MPYASTGKWNSPRKINSSLLSSPRIDASNTAEDPWALQLPVTPSAFLVTWPFK
ncbi:hypothetical protein SK128_021349, partial [Halocaridina rubra]